MDNSLCWHKPILISLWSSLWSSGKSFLSLSDIISVCVCVCIYIYIYIYSVYIHMDVTDGSDSIESACNARDLGLTPGSGRSPREGNGYPLQYS